MVQRTPNQVIRLRDFYSLVAVSNLCVSAVYIMQYNRNCVVFGANVINWTDIAGWRVLYCAVLLWMCGRLRDRRVSDRISLSTRDKMVGWLV